MKYKAEYVVNTEIDYSDLIEHVEEELEGCSPPSENFCDWLRGQCLESVLQEMMEEIGNGYLCKGRIDDCAWGQFIASKYRQDCC